MKLSKGQFKENIMILSGDIAMFLSILILVSAIGGVRIAKVSGGSMLPLLGDKGAVVYIRTKDVEVGNIALFKQGGVRNSKLVVGENGDVVTLSSNGNLYNNNKRLNVNTNRGEGQDINRTVHGDYFMSGTSSDSLDSFYYGSVPKEDVIGKVIIDLTTIGGED